MKRSRQNKILELIDQYEIETQEDLARYLTEAGFQVTQATISRDIRELSLTKVSGRNGLSLIHISSPRDPKTSRMPSSA